MLSKSLQRITRAAMAGQPATISTATRCFSSSEDKSTSSDNLIKTQSIEDNQIVETEDYLQFSKAPIISNFGDLPKGEIPEPLKFNRPFEITTLANGIRVCTEKAGTMTATIGVHFGAGSRQDTLATTGCSYALQKMMMRGTSARSKTAFSQEVESMGARVNSEAGRESQHVSVTCFKSDVNKVVDILGDAVSSATLDAAEFELCKQDLADELSMSATDFKYTTIENSHFNSYREHMMGQPIKGDADQIGHLTVDDLQNYRATNWFGDNIVVVATGNVNHDQLVQQVQGAFHSISKTATAAQPNSEKNIYSPCMLFIRDDEMYNSNIGVFYDAPSIKHPDYYSFLLLKYVFGSFRIDKHAEHLNDVKKQYNSMHAMLGDLVDVTMADSEYYAYSDSGLFGNYFFGNEVFTRQMNYCGVCLPTIYSHYMNDVEVVRGRNSLYNALMQLQASDKVNNEIGKQMLSLGRRLTRSEIASRVSHHDAYHFKHLCNEWFYDAEPSFTNWGPIEHTSQIGSYKFFKINTMSTVTNAHHSLFN